MKIIPFDTIANLGITTRMCYDWVSSVIESKPTALLPAKISIKPDIEEVFYNTMPAILPHAGWAGTKIVTRYPERIPTMESQILLYDLSDGSNLALLDGTWITAMRTGAVAAHSICLLAKRGFSKLGFIGLGNTARATLAVLLDVIEGREIVIKLKTYKDQHVLFAERFKKYDSVRFEFCETHEEVVRGSDVVVSAATVFDENICTDDCFDEGVLVMPVHSRGFLNCDLFFDKVFADDEGHVKGFKYFDKFNSFSEVHDVVMKTKPGRENDFERILVYNMGIALHDLYFAGKIYEMVGDSCPDVSLGVPTDKIWV